jgi:hypothetical protein
VDPRAGQTLFSTQAKTWMASKQSNRRTTTARDQSVMKALVLPRFGERPLAAITVESIEEWIEAMVHKGKASGVLVPRSGLDGYQGTPRRGCVVATAGPD